MSIFKRFSFSAFLPVLNEIQSNFVSKRFRYNGRFFEKPLIGHGKSFRRKVHFPDEYTVKPLEVTNLAGRDPVTGRVVVKGLGGGVKHKYHWIKWLRDGPKEGPPIEEKVLKIIKCGCRTSHVALVACGDELKYILATENMKAGDIIKSSRFIPQNPVRANEGDAYPVGALPIGTIVHNVQIHPSRPVSFIHSAGCFGTIKGHINDKVIVQLPRKKDIAVNKECMATVGRLSNAEHSSIKLGTPQRNRELGNRPRSGLWQRKTGRFGRKIRRPPKLRVIEEENKPEILKPIRCTLPGISAGFTD